MDVGDESFLLSPAKKGWYGDRQFESWTRDGAVLAAKEHGMDDARAKGAYQA